MDRRRRALWRLSALLREEQEQETLAVSWRTAAAIDADVNAALVQFYRHAEGSYQLVRKAAGVLVFPTIFKAGMGIGGEYGEGALRIRGKTVAYFNTVSASLGFQLGAQARSVIILFMTKGALAHFRRTDGWYFNTVSASLGFQLGAQARSVMLLFMSKGALEYFRRTDGWKVGVDESVALATVGVGGSIYTDRITSPMAGFIFDGKGLMYYLTLEGSKISRIFPDLARMRSDERRYLRLLLDGKQTVVRAA